MFDWRESFISGAVLDIADCTENMVDLEKLIFKKNKKKNRRKEKKIASQNLMHSSGKYQVEGSNQPDVNRG